MKIYTTTVIEHGSGYALLFPPEFTKENSLKVGDEVDIVFEANDKSNDTSIKATKPRVIIYGKSNT